MLSWADLDGNILLSTKRLQSVENWDELNAAMESKDVVNVTVAREVKGGVIDGTYYDAAGVKAISNIPSKEVLLGKLLGSIQSPIANFARVIKQVAESKDGEVA